MPTLLSITTSAEGGTVRIHLDGEIDLTNVEAVRGCVLDHLGVDAVGTVVADLSAVTFIDSIGVSTLVGCRRTAAEHDRVFQVVGAAGLVARVLDIMGLTGFLSASASPPA